MRRFRYQHWVAVPAIVLLVAAVVLAPNLLYARQHARVADFVPPMSASAARARVAAAQQTMAEQQASLTRQLNAISPEELPLVQTVFVDQTGHHLSDRAGFLTFWRKHGGVMIFGYPISEEIVEDGRIVQYFERARFEFHPEYLGTEDQIQLSLLGREMTEGREFAPGDPNAGAMYFPETGHTLSGKFRQFWLKRGGLRIFGYPISEPIEEIDPVDGQPYTVQYFERARFEHHPERLGAFYQQQAAALGLTLAALNEVQISDLGRQAAQARGHSFGARRQFQGTAAWSSMIWPQRIEIDLTKQQLTAYEGDLPVFTAPVATGRDGFNTPPGSYAIYARYDMQTMTGSAGGESWYVPDIPWVQYVVGGVALHGTYWHDAWGTGARMSHGCINLNIDDAQWLYEWADIGTPVEIHY